MAVKELKTVAEFKQAKASSKPTLVDFHATWCGPCKMIAPKVEQFSEQFTNVDFYKLDVDEVPEAASESGVTAMPTLHLYKDDEKIGEVVGANIAGIQQLLTKAQ